MLSQQSAGPRQDNIPKKTYIYVIGQHPNNILRFDLPIKIGYSDHLDDRIIKFGAEQWCIKPKFLRIFECDKEHSRPDKVFHKVFHELIEHSDIEMLDKKKELFKVDNLKIIDKVMEFFSYLKSGSRYYTDPQEIEELIKRDDIVKDIVNNLVDDVISENVDIVSKNLIIIEERSNIQSDEISDDIIKIIKEYFDKGCINKSKNNIKPISDNQRRLLTKRFSKLENLIKIRIKIKDFIKSDNSKKRQIFKDIHKDKELIKCNVNKSDISYINSLLNYIDMGFN